MDGGVGVRVGGGGGYVKWFVDQAFNVSMVL